VVNKADQQVEKGGMMASFFMALTTALVSFSCTGPIVGSLLVEGASGHVLRPLLGMLSFGVGFALPFTVLALFPSLLKSLPKSGGWMNAVKVVLGLIMLAFSLKFIMNIDQTHHLGLISRNVYLVIWMIIFIVMGIYLLGKIRLTHESETQTIGIGRLLLAMVAFSFAGYLFTGLLGSPLANISSFLPPQERTSVSSGSNSGIIPHQLCEEPKYASFFQLPFGLNGYFDYKQGMECARKLKKPILLDFKGHTCSNCKKMENSVWSNAGILQQLNNNFVIIALYTDDFTEITQAEWVKSEFDGKMKKTIGEINSDFQVTRFKTNTVPMYVIVDSAGNTISEPVGFDPDVKKFDAFLKKGSMTITANR
jgi:thiol:disulfide interchange protein DsbD